MAKFKVLVAILLMMIATQAQAHGIKGGEVAAPHWIAACITEHGPGVCGEPMWAYGARGGHAGRKNALSPELDAPHWIGD